MLLMDHLFCYQILRSRASWSIFFVHTREPNSNEHVTYPSFPVGNGSIPEQICRCSMVIQWYIALTNDTSVPIFYRTVEALLTDDKTSADRVKVIKSTPAERVNVLQVLVGGIYKVPDFYFYAYTNMTYIYIQCNIYIYMDYVHFLCRWYVTGQYTGTSPNPKKSPSMVLKCLGILLKWSNKSGENDYKKLVGRGFLVGWSVGWLVQGHKDKLGGPSRQQYPKLGWLVSDIQWNLQGQKGLPTVNGWTPANQLSER